MNSKSLLVIAVLSSILVSAQAHAYGCRAKIRQTVSCALQSVSKYSVIDHGALRLERVVMEQDPQSSRVCREVGQISTQARLHLALKGSTEPQHAIAYGDLAYDQKAQMFSITNLMANRGLFFLESPPSESEPNHFLGVPKSISGTFSLLKPNAQIITVSIDETTMQMTAYCVPKALNMDTDLNACIDQTDRKGDYDQACGPKVYKANGGI